MGCDLSILRLLTALVSLVNLLASGGLSKDVAPYFAGANLFAAVKNDGGFRPIEVGNTLRRLTSKCFSHAVASRAATLLLPFQFGIGVRGGCEGIIHATRKLLANSEIPEEEKVILQVDFENAFNLADRSKMFEEVRTHFPEISRWVESTYGVEAFLNHGESTILSSTGFHQGDPLAGLIFSLTMHPVVLKIDRENSWFLDDGALAGDKSGLQKAVDILRQEGPPRGLFLSSTKSKVWSQVQLPDMDREDPLECGIQLDTAEGIKLLGSPIGSLTFEEGIISEKIDKAEYLMEKLSELEDPHSEYVLLRSCFSSPKLSYIMRTVDTLPHSTLMQKFDDAVWSAFLAVQ